MRLIGAVAFAATLVVPVCALIFRTVRCDPSLLIEVFSEGYWGLLAKTIGLAIGAAAIANLLALPVAFVMGGRRSSWLLAMVTLPVMMPAMVLVFGWQQFWGPYTPGLEGWAPWLRTMWCWASWLWPVPALIIAAGWSRGGRAGFDSALMDASRWRAFLGVALPNLMRHVGVAALVILAVMLGDYTVPHANGVVVFATELLATAESHAFDVAGAKIAVGCLVPLVFLVLAILVIGSVWNRQPATDEHRRISAGKGAVVIPAVVILTIGAPLWLLISGQDVGDHMQELFATYGSELAGTIGVCVGTGLAVVCVGVFVTGSRFSRWMMLLAMIAGVLPGTLIGESMLAAYQRVDPIYNHWPILLLALVGRYAWVGCLTCWVAMRSLVRDQTESMRVEGLQSRSEIQAAMLGHQWATLAVGAFLATAFALADVDVVSLVAVPSPRMMATILIEKFHRFETGMLVSIGLVMTLAVTPAVAFAMIALRRRDINV